MAVRELGIVLALPGEQPSVGIATVEDRNLATRLVKAGRTLLGWWAVAAGCVLLPVAHFVLVPSFLLIGLVMGVARFRVACALLRVEGVCPRCRVPRTLAGSGRFRHGGTVHCDGCGSQLEVRGEEPASAPG